MKTNISIDLNNEQLSQLADHLGGKETTRRASRADIVKLCQQFVAGMVAEQAKIDRIVHKTPSAPKVMLRSKLYIVAQEDAEHLKGKSDGFIRGYNTVKRGSKK